MSTHTTGEGDGRLRAVDLFSGSGAVTCGLKPAFDVVAAADVDPVACRTYAANHPDVRLFVEDIRDLEPARLLEEVPRARGADLLVVCAPCQPFSNHNRRRAGDPRAPLVLQTLRFAAALRPRGILFENVPGFAGASGVFEDLRRGLRATGYVVGEPRRLNAADLGVPQRRHRCVTFAALSLEAVHAFEVADLRGPPATVVQAIRGLPPLASGQADPHDALHSSRAHSDVALRRLRATPKDGGSRDAWPADLRLKCHGDRRGYPDVYGRMAWDDVAPTLTTGCTDVTRGRFAHPEQDRAITLREAALLQTFPRDYVFLGSRKAVATQVGNAVPVRMVEAMVPALVGALACCPSPGRTTALLRRHSH